MVKDIFPPFWSLPGSYIKAQFSVANIVYSCLLINSSSSRLQGHNIFSVTSRSDLHDIFYLVEIRRSRFFRV
ncbi:hypothetical protein Y032_0017g3346 [Ancylostoma ceylanicum]|uniref:Uncharacterized protein n=1 Tax=Ancylostoma ceylanicum TaxID=53326 RepID=A0A016V5Y9_9BILA|nr:hypothetical protein Y032_0017g3346 [Ancylostoma ceylanicum]